MTNTALWLKGFLLAFVQFTISSEAILCFNGTRSPFLVDAPQYLEIKDCNEYQCAEIVLSTSETTETYVEYHAGCEDICQGKTSDTVKCHRCNSELCNKALKDEIIKTHFTCLSSPLGFHLYYHEKAVKIYCNRNVAQCYYRVHLSREQLMGGCYVQGHDLNCNDPDGPCDICDTRDCNEPSKGEIQEMKDTRLATRQAESSIVNVTDTELADIVLQDHSMITTTPRSGRPANQPMQYIAMAYDDNSGAAACTAGAIACTAALALIVTAW